MTKPYSGDLRDRLIAAVSGGMSARAAAERYSVCPSTAVRWVKRWRDTGSYAPLAMGGDYRSKLADERDWLLSRIGSKPDITLFELRAELRERGVTVGYGAIWRFFAREGISFKKKRAAAGAGAG